MSTIKVNTIQDTGTNNAMTISGGVVTFPNNPSGVIAPIEIIANNTSGVSAASEIEIDLSTSTNYIKQQIILYGVYGSAASDLYCQLRATGGAYRTGATYGYGYNLVERTTGADTNGTGATTANYMRLNWYGQGDTAVEANVLTMNFHLNGETGYYTTLDGTKAGMASTGYMATTHFTGQLKQAESNDRFKIYPSSGTLYVGGYVHYGFRRT
tara:strand:+ start:121 stop:756 length:636 start_codon:yes stop_codon:yes gene_type:complete